MTYANKTETKPTANDWALLLLLSMLWGGSFLFIGVAVKALPALLVVFMRVGLAAVVLIPLHLVVQGPLPRDRKTWFAAAGMSVLNNVMPFTAITWSENYIGSGLASVINATTPMFAVLFMALFGFEALVLRKVLALCLGLIGVLILMGGGFGDLGPQTLGILAVSFASLCYGLSTVWAKKFLIGIPPMTTATCQITSSAMMMAVLSFSFSQPSLYAKASWETWEALIAIAVLSTAVAYLIFFRIIAKAGPSFVALVTMLVPLSAIVLGMVVLGEGMSLHEFIGAAIIIAALAIIDGRVLRVLQPRLA
jgi:drug/metabolite transporter (DMT)-like permease